MAYCTSYSRLSSQKYRPGSDINRDGSSLSRLAAAYPNSYSLYESNKTLLNSRPPHLPYSGRNTSTTRPHPPSFNYSLQPSRSLSIDRRLYTQPASDPTPTRSRLRPYYRSPSPQDEDEQRPHMSARVSELTSKFESLMAPMASPSLSAARLRRQVNRAASSYAVVRSVADENSVINCTDTTKIFERSFRSYSSQSSGSSSGLGSMGASASLGGESNTSFSSTLSTPTSTLTPRPTPDENTSKKGRGLVGLTNLGNTCFMNSILQCLSHATPLRDYCLDGQFKSDINNNNDNKNRGALFKAFRELLVKLWHVDADSAINPGFFKAIMQKVIPKFSGYSQHDSQEFLRYLLQSLHEDINRSGRHSAGSEFSDDVDKLSIEERAANCWRRYLKTDNSHIVDIFVGQLRSDLYCTSCNHVSTTFDPFWDLSLPIPHDKRYNTSVGLLDCLDAFTKEEILDGAERPKCENCKEVTKCTKRFSIYKFPTILVLHLKRFSGQKYQSRLSTHVSFPFEELSLAKYSSKKSTDFHFNLFAISNHIGSAYMGHYTAYVKAAGDKWALFDDTRVSAAGSRPIITSDAYILFYELVSSSKVTSHF